MNIAGTPGRRVAAGTEGYGSVRWARARGRVSKRNGDRSDVG
jgi:hypothetical protein